SAACNLRAVRVEKPRIELLGALALVRGDSRVGRFRLQKAASVLGYLAVFRGSAHPRETLIEMFWPRSRPEAGRNNLSQALSALRPHLEPPGVAAGSVIVSDRASVMLARETTATDLEELEDALERASRARGDERTRLLGGAVELYRGELLLGQSEDWLRGERERVRRAALDAASALAAELEAAGALEA